METGNYILFNDIVEPYSLYLLKKAGDNGHPRITIATSGIDKRSFDLELVEIEYANTSN